MVEVIQGDCLEVLAGMPAESIDACVTDPPYGLGFMGRDWDHGVPGVPFWDAVLRVLKPGGYLLAFGGTRTQHRLVCAIEDAGFEVRDQIGWAYGSGFPKSLDVSKAIDRVSRGAMVRDKLLHFAEVRGVNGKWLEEHGVASASSFADWTTGGHVPSEKNWLLVKDALGVTTEEESAFERAVVGRGSAGLGSGSGGAAAHQGGFKTEYDITAPATPEAAAWQGWGTALKPAWEPICVARNPIRGTVAANVLRYGTGAMNIDGCRVEHDGSGVWGNHGQNPDNHKTEPGSNGTTMGTGWTRPGSARNDLGRWPANLVHDGSDEVLACFPGEAGGGFGTRGGSRQSGYNFGEGGAVGFGDTGSAARFFYTSKASSSEREGGDHPTVKPVSLMRWLVRLVTPPGGTVLDPFAGSGTTGVACQCEGFDAVLIEREPKYVGIARRRLSAGPLFYEAAE